MAYTEEFRAQAREIMERYPEGKQRSALLPMLHLVQSQDGYITQDGIAFCAEMIGITKAQVAAVSTFYTMYKREPTGDYLVSVCTNTLCDVMGGQKVFDALREYLGVDHDETTGDGKITLEHAECLAACDYAPVMTVNYEFFDKTNPDEAVQLAKNLRNGERPTPTRGAPLCTLKEMSRQLAGWAEDREAGLAGNAAADPTLAGARLAADAGITAPPVDPEVSLVKKEDAS
ncbi:NADH-quinone oxidoreductase subunit NuoE [Stackebrandtia nassauensis]|uniref:NADH-quinone oxidoreductase, E subunit n=1 Tax=Stackebrandtia nassauensis (strain DSM 44728 / CIP 108903 / NRRL B-16338 / NBRC 102104 / LLR-40K-21) TaxID=446470 RepID=D3PU41_STANL|nr:NADH-quinone oxidoreductase subunit NuoE [Stackebrandtia nassauensis]ADD40987.1 NADH-quinone oxidoreductase, E subunit [Stackebrandtia nassauensis DSM 44728]